MSTSMREERTNCIDAAGSVTICPKCGTGGNGTLSDFPFVNGEFRGVDVEFECPKCFYGWTADWETVSQNK
jgi:predicted RNA-binding Zn-ribbon protein involved in translation (DUF1610 family)